MPPNRKSELELSKQAVLGLSQSYPNDTTLSRALQEVKMEMDMDTELNLDQLSSSCFGALKMEKSAIEDDDLRPLSWLHSTDLLRDLDLDDEDDDGQSKENEENGDGMMNPYSNLSNNQGDPMDPKRHINSKPPFSFSCLIFMAIEDCIHKRLPVKDIYQWIQDHFPYFRTAPTGWKNSVRHNLSLNKCFRKVDKMKGQTIGKGSLWCVDPEYRPNLLQALRKTPYHPYHHVLPYTPHHVMHVGGPLSNIQCNPNNRLPTVLSAYSNGFPIPGHIPLVERLLNGQQGYVPPSSNGISSETEVDAAATMMMFRTPPEKRVSEHARLKRESCPQQGMNGSYQPHAPLQPRPSQPIARPTLSDLAETALAVTGLNNKPRTAQTPLSKAALQSRCTPQPIASEDHTYSLSTCLKRAPESNGLSDDDPLECDMSDMSEEDFSDDDMEQDPESRRLGDSGYVPYAGCEEDNKKHVKKTLKVQLPIKKRPPRDGAPSEGMADKDLAEGADALLNLAGIKTEMVPMRSISPEAISPASR